MATTVAASRLGEHAGGERGGALAPIAWRNLWRNGRRTALTAGGIAFAVFLLVFALSMQEGAFEVMVDNAARLATGHAQIQHHGYSDEPRLEWTVRDAPVLADRLAALPEVEAVSARAEAFALVALGERSFGAQVIGVEPALEAGWSTLPGTIRHGRYLSGPSEAVAGAALARNLGAEAGDELVLLGTAREGAVAAVVARLVGIFESGHPVIDRSVLQIPIDDFRAAWNLGDTEAHRLVIVTSSVRASERLPGVLPDSQGGDWRLLDWRELMPELVQTIDVKQVSTYLIFGLIAVVVTFSVVNSFMMIVFERRTEFGMLMAIGMRPGRIIRQLCLEAFFVAALGVFLGLVLATAVLLPLAAVGMPLPGDSAELLARYNLPERMYPQFSGGAAFTAALIMIVGTQVAALAPVLKIRSLKPAQALRGRT